MAFLFEYGNWENIKNANGLKQILGSIWRERSLFFGDFNYSEEEKKSFQPFLQFDGNEIRAKNYSGFIQRGDELIEIYPKVFRESNFQDKVLMLDHIFYWLSYCRKWKFPFSKAGLSAKDFDNFPELIIYLITNQIHTTVSGQPLSQYQAVEEALLVPRGSININRYIRNSLSRSNFHLFECDYDPFVYDNKVNRVIKYCARLLLQQTKLSENIRLLQETIHMLDEVDDLPCTIQTVDSIVLNNFYEEYIEVLNNCRLILLQQVYSSTPYDISQWCLLLPMDYIFEDFIAGFLEDNFSSDWIVEYQKSNMNLTSDPQAFQMNHDILLTSKTDPKKRIIVDTKYKIRDPKFKEDKKKGISQSDMYQVASYAFRRGCEDVFLLYPNINEELSQEDKFTIQSQFPGGHSISITAAEVPFWSIEGFESLSISLRNFFSALLKDHA